MLPSTIGKTAVTPWRGGLQVHLEDMEGGQVGRGQSSVLPMDSPRDAMSPPRSARRFSRSQENGF